MFQLFPLLRFFSLWFHILSWRVLQTGSQFLLVRIAFYWFFIMSFVLLTTSATSFVHLFIFFSAYFDIFFSRWFKTSRLKECNHYQNIIIIMLFIIKLIKGGSTNSRLNRNKLLLSNLDFACLYDRTGMFVPSLLSGAAFGRLVGHLLHR